MICDAVFVFGVGVLSGSSSSSTPPPLLFAPTAVHDFRAGLSASYLYRLHNSSSKGDGLSLGQASGYRKLHKITHPVLSFLHSV